MDTDAWWPCLEVELLNTDDGAGAVVPPPPPAGLAAPVAPAGTSALAGSKFSCTRVKFELLVEARALGRMASPEPTEEENEVLAACEGRGWLTLWPEEGEEGEEVEVGGCCL